MRYYEYKTLPSFNHLGLKMAQIVTDILLCSLIIWLAIKIVKKETGKTKKKKKKCVLHSQASHMEYHIQYPLSNPSLTQFKLLRRPTGLGHSFILKRHMLVGTEDNWINDPILVCRVPVSLPVLLLQVLLPPRSLLLLPGEVG